MSTLTHLIKGVLIPKCLQNYKGGRKMKNTDYHRQIVNQYYKTLIDRFGLDKTLRGVRLLKYVVWSENGLKLAERKVTP